MKTYYKISEISKLYGIGTDSLRYYEKLGLLHPRRDDNGYRMYNLKDLYKLNIIRDLRQLNFSMEQIREYLNGEGLDDTIRLLEREQKLLRQQRKLLKAREDLLAERISGLKSAIHVQTNQIRMLTLPSRPCVQISEYITRDEEMDFLIKKLHRRHEKQIRDLGNQQIGAYPSMEDVRRGIGNAYTSVFFVLEQGTPNPDFELPAGQYLSCFYRGSYEQNMIRFQELLDYAAEQGYTAPDRPFELYEVDNRDTSRQEEFLTEIQLRILPSKTDL